MKIAIAADHGGIKLKTALCEHLTSKSVEVIDYGAHDTESVDYPDFASQVANALEDQSVDQGILICTTGLGMSMAANRYPHIRAALCTCASMAEMARSHNDANVLVLGAAVTPIADAVKILEKWLTSSFSQGERHQRRVKKIATHAHVAIDTAAIRGADDVIFQSIRSEYERQANCLNLIASENGVSRAVRQAQGSIMTNKYAEGYPGRRWYNGCDFVDQAETTAIDRAKELFGADHANVQPHCGSSANMAVYASMLEPGDTILAMSLADGGHLTHGSPVNFSGLLYNVIPYGVSRETERIDFEELTALAEKHKPKLIVAGASAYSRQLTFERFRDVADRVGARLMVDMAHIAGLVAGGVHPSPVPFADYVTSTTHKTLRGPRSGLILCREAYAKDIDKTVFPGLQGGPLMHVIAAKAVCFLEALSPDFKAYASDIIANATAMATRFQEKGVRIVSGGTETHLMLLDVSTLKITGKDAALALDRAGIVVNKNAIPFDTASPFVTSGIRIGTPGVTSRGMRKKEMTIIADWIMEVLHNLEDEALLKRIRGEVAELCKAFPPM